MTVAAPWLVIPPAVTVGADGLARARQGAPPTMTTPIAGVTTGWVAIQGSRAILVSEAQGQPAVILLADVPGQYLPVHAEGSYGCALPGSQGTVGAPADGIVFGDGRCYKLDPSREPKAGPVRVGVVAVYRDAEILPNGEDRGALVWAEQAVRWATLQGWAKAVESLAERLPKSAGREVVETLANAGRSALWLLALYGVYRTVRRE